MSSEHTTDAPRWAYTAPDGPHGHWQITDEHGAIHACPHQPPSDELLAALLSPRVRTALERAAPRRGGFADQLAVRIGDGGPCSSPGWPR